MVRVGINNVDSAVEMRVEGVVVREERARRIVSCGPRLGVGPVRLVFQEGFEGGYGMVVPNRPEKAPQVVIGVVGGRQNAALSLFSLGKLGALSTRISSLSRGVVQTSNFV